MDPRHRGDNLKSSGCLLGINPQPQTTTYTCGHPSGPPSTRASHTEGGNWKRCMLRCPRSAIQRCEPPTDLAIAPIGPTPKQT
eukprot:scaffold42284_cov49-Prasinocladus_malaysianus.AAC.2